MVVASIGGEVRGEFTLTEPGRYGGPGPLDPKLIVRGSSAEEGSPVTFTVGGVGADPGSPITIFKDAGDIPAWAQGVVAAAVKDGLLRGYPEGDGSTTFRANRPISRAELASLAARILEKELGPVAPGALQFADAERIPAWAKESVAVAASRGIIAGYPDRTFRAENNVTRAEAAAMILRLLDLLCR